LIHNIGKRKDKW